MGRFYSTPLFCYLLGFVGPYLLTFVPFVTVVGHYSAATHTLILLSISGFVLGVLAAQRWTRARNIWPADPLSSAVALPNGTANILYAWYAVAVACLVLEFVAIGGIPLFIDDIEIVRLNLKINGLTRLLAVSLGLVSVLMLYASGGFKMERSTQLTCRNLGFFGLFLLLLTGNRSEGGIFLAGYLVTLMLKDRTVFRSKYVLWITTLLVLFTALNIYRQTQHDPRYSLYAMQNMLFVPNKLQMALYPLYATVTYNFTILDKIVAATNGRSITHGIYTFFGLLSIFPTKPIQFGEFKNNLLGISFYAELTSTYLSNFYVDFGTWGAVTGSFLHGVFIQKIYTLAKFDRRFVLLYGTIYSNYLLFFYFYPYYLFLLILTIPITALFCIYGFKYRTASAPVSAGKAAIGSWPPRFRKVPGTAVLRSRPTFATILSDHKPKAGD